MVSLLRTILFVETNPPIAPGREAIYLTLNFRADLAYKRGVNSRQGIRKYVFQPYFKNCLVNYPFVEFPVFLVLLVLPLNIFLVICISYVTSDLVIRRSDLDVLCS